MSFIVVVANLEGVARISKVLKKRISVPEQRYCCGTAWSLELEATLCTTLASGAYSSDFE